jgi:hypothetical protein
MNRVLNAWRMWHLRRTIARLRRESALAYGYSGYYEDLGAEMAIRADLLADRLKGMGDA